MQSCMKTENFMEKQTEMLEKILNNQIEMSRKIDSMEQHLSRTCGYTPLPSSKRPRIEEDHVEDKPVQIVRPYLDLKEELTRKFRKSMAEALVYFWENDAMLSYKRDCTNKTNEKTFLATNQLFWKVTSFIQTDLRHFLNIPEYTKGEEVRSQWRDSFIRLMDEKVTEMENWLNQYNLLKGNNFTRSWMQNNNKEVTKMMKSHCTEEQCKYAKL